MTSPLYIAQQIFSAYTASTNDIPELFINGTTSNTTQIQQSSVLSFPTDVSSLFSFFLSFSALREWLKFIMFGSALESLRRLAFYLFDRIYNSFFVTARFEDSDSLHWMMMWLSKRPEWKRARDVEVSSNTYGVNAAHLGTPEAGAESIHKHVQLIPADSMSITFFAHGSWIRATRGFRENRYSGRVETLELRIFSLRQDILYTLLNEAKELYEAAEENTISIYSSDIHSSWRLIASRPRRPLTSIVLDPGIKSLLVDDARDFLESRPWYAARGIPFRRGYLLHGTPGSGKTSIIHSLAGELELDIYIIPISRPFLDDTALADLISDLPEKCIALMEDIDAAFDRNINRGELDEDSDPIAKNGDQNKKTQQQQIAAPTSQVTLSGLLNALDGVGAQEGRILFATTNRYSSLDPALIRPGRMDIHVHFKLASKYQARELYRCFYHPESEAKEREAEASSSYLKETEQDRDPTQEDKYCGYSSTDEKNKITSALSFEEGSAHGSLVPDEVSFSGASHQARAPKLSSAQVAALSEKFAEVIPQREFSMAALQGYLMTYKVRPYEAVKDAPVWIENERTARASKEMRAKAAAEAKPEVEVDSSAPVGSTSPTPASVLGP